MIISRILKIPLKHLENKYSGLYSLESMVSVFLFKKQWNIN